MATAGATVMKTIMTLTSMYSCSEYRLAGASVCVGLTTTSSFPSSWLISVTCSRTGSISSYVTVTATTSTSA